jgi:hypothetical protein
MQLVNGAAKSKSEVPLSRLTNPNYLDHHRFLKQAWEELNSLHS